MGGVGYSMPVAPRPRGEETGMKTRSLAFALTALTLASPPALTDVFLPPEIRGGEIDVTQWAASPPGLSARILARGREVYSDLLDAQTAAVSHDSLGLRLALQDARRELRELGTPSEMRSLDAQLAIIRRDLGNTRKIPDKDLWVPVSAEVEQLLVNAPEAVKAKAREAATKGQAAAAQGNRAAAGKALNTLATEIEYRAGGFPLDIVTEDVRSAGGAARASEPDWAAIGETLKSALAQMHWVTRIEAHGLLTAYYEAKDAAAILPDSAGTGEEISATGSQGSQRDAGDGRAWGGCPDVDTEARPDGFRCARCGVQAERATAPLAAAGGRPIPEECGLVSALR
jgi:hypothetical protein